MAWCKTVVSPLLMHWRYTVLHQAHHCIFSRITYFLSSHDALFWWKVDCIFFYSISLIDTNTMLLAKIHQGGRHDFACPIKSVIMNDDDLASSAARSSLSIILILFAPICTVITLGLTALIQRNTNLYYHFISFLHIKLVHVVEILPHGRQGVTYIM